MTVKTIVKITSRCSYKFPSLPFCKKTYLKDSPGLDCDTLANDENISGAPLPNAIIVIPAMLCESLKIKFVTG
jgi:hypothetical protein